MTTKTKADEFKVGDIVYCVMYGRGVVEEVCSSDDMLVVAVSFDKGYFIWYTKDGRYNIKLNRTLFFSEPKIEASVVRPLCEPSGQASCPSAFVPTLVGKMVVVLEYACYPQVFVVTWEDESMFGNDVYKCIKSNSTVYEVSSENLLK